MMEDECLLGEDPVVGDAGEIRMVREREVEFAEFETRMRKLIVDLLEPTIQRVSRQQVELDAVRSLLEKHTQSLAEVSLVAVKVQQQITAVEQFREEMNRWDLHRRSQESKVNEDTTLMKQELESFRYNLERKEGTLESMQRTVDRVVSEINRAMDIQDQHKQHNDDRMDQLNKNFQGFRKDIEIQLISLESKHNSLADELWGEETGLAKVTGELNRTNQIVSVLNEETKKLQKGKASTDKLNSLQEEVNTSAATAVSDISQLRTTVDKVVDQVKDHFKTAANTIAAHNATMLSEVRQSYTEELQHAARVRTDVISLMEETKNHLSNLGNTVDSSKEQTNAMVTEVRLDLEELNKKRKRDKSNQDIENRQLKKRLGGVFDNSDLVLKGLEHITGVLAVLLESDRVSACLEAQDDDDRQKVALTGYKTPGDTQRSAPVISLDNRCLCCSGQAATVLAGFKIACLQYQPGPVKYNSKTFNRSDLLGVRRQLLEQAFEALQSGPDSKPVSEGSKTERRTTAVPPLPAL
eukprot:GHVQ01022582.1.p1 GENE.GHVQ01022582.1~~GHVQ01022582.1.p1  ORF type:complete len:525 (-),score=92.95 GHVQ01022582.1:258-1832(-)